MAKTYHLALVDGRHGRAIIEVANTVDQVSCECLEYWGERETTIKGLRDRFNAHPEAFLRWLNQECPGRVWTAVTFRRIGRDDYSAGHVDTARAEIAEYLRETA